MCHYLSPASEIEHGNATISESLFLGVRDAAVYHDEDGGWRQDELGLAVCLRLHRTQVDDVITASMLPW